MKDLVTVLGGIGLLIGLFLVLNKGKDSVSIIEALGKNATKGIATLQGR
jgi:hypothetical protein